MAAEENIKKIRKPPSCSVCKGTDHNKSTCPVKVNHHELVQKHKECELEQKRSLLTQAEQELAEVIASAEEDYFSSVEEKEETLERIRQNPEAILSSAEKPFMKKIAKAMMAVTALTLEMEEKDSDEQLTTAFAMVTELTAKVTQLTAEVTELKNKITPLEQSAEKTEHDTVAVETQLKEMADLIRSQKEDYESLLMQQRAYFESRLADQAKKYEERFVEKQKGWGFAKK